MFKKYIFNSQNTKAVRDLVGAPAGTFVVRPCAPRPDCLVLSYKLPSGQVNIHNLLCFFFVKNKIDFCLFIHNRLLMLLLNKPIKDIVLKINQNKFSKFVLHFYLLYS